MGRLNAILCVELLSLRQLPPCILLHVHTLISNTVCTRTYSKSASFPFFCSCFRRISHERVCVVFVGGREGGPDKKGRDQCKERGRCHPERQYVGLFSEYVWFFLEHIWLFSECIWPFWNPWALVRGARASSRTSAKGTVTCKRVRISASTSTTKKNQKKRQELV